jgi:hypothetical protein
MEFIRMKEEETENSWEKPHTEAMRLLGYLGIVKRSILYLHVIYVNIKLKSLSLNNICADILSISPYYPKINTCHVVVVRYCLIKTTPCVKRKDLLEIQTAGLPTPPSPILPTPPPPRSGAATWVNWVMGFIGGAKPWGRERVSGP